MDTTLHRPSLVTVTTNIHTMTISNLDRIYLIYLTTIPTFQVYPGLGGHQQLHQDILPPGNVLDAISRYSTVQYSTCSGCYLSVQMSGCSIWRLVLDDNFFVLLLGGTSTNHYLLSIPSHLPQPGPRQSNNVSIIHGRHQQSFLLHVQSFRGHFV